MPDLDRDLGALAPDVDTDVALEQFQRRRSDRPGPPWPLLAAAALVVLAAIVGVVALMPDDDAPVTSGPAVDGPATNGGDVPFEVLSVEPAVAEMGTLAAVTTEDQAPEFWDQTGAQAPYPEVDFGGTVLVAITIPDDACPPDLTEFTRDGDTLTPVFVETVDVCNEPLIPKTYVVGFPRDLADESITVRLPADDTYGYAEQLLTVALREPVVTSVPGVGVVPDPPPCADIERFAAQLVETGISYDYDASTSPSEVAAGADVVLSGQLTGGFTADMDLPEGLNQLGYEVEIDFLFKSPPAGDLVNPLTVHVDVGSVDPAQFEAAITAGIPVVVMAEWIERPSGERLFAGIEGFATGCPDGPLLGFVGTQGEWAEMTDLEALRERLSS